jgi:hypothetical protein
MDTAIIRTRNYVLKISNQEIKPGDTVMTLANPDSIPYQVRHWFTIKCLHPQRRVVLAHKPINGAQPLDDVPLMEDTAI